jgi:hypothetical protein
VGVSVPQESPQSTVAVGRFVLELGAPTGTSISLSTESEHGDSRSLARALKKAGADSNRKSVAVDSFADAVDEASAATAGVERAEGLFRALAEGKVLDPRQLSGEIDALLDLVERLDREGRWREALRLARALSGLLALLMRWADLVRSLNISLRAARKLGDVNEVARSCHELGTLHLAAENPAGAERALGEARETRARLGDSRGVAATDRNLQVLCRHLRQLVRDGKLVERGRALDNLWRFRAVLAVGVAMLLVGGVASAVVDGGSGVVAGNSGEQPALCANGTDDPGCADGTEAPRDDRPVGECANDRDDDGDRLVDRDDPGCADGTEAPATERRASDCANGSDDDRDNLVDLKDPGCESTRDDDESNVVRVACADGSDNDNDGPVDLKDPGCESTTDDDETNVVSAACADSRDNDRDKLVDLDDPGCTSTTDEDETNVASAACADGNDNDSDKLVDLSDPGCASTTDNDETDPAVGLR